MINLENQWIGLHSIQHHLPTLHPIIDFINCFNWLWQHYALSLWQPCYFSIYW